MSFLCRRLPDRKIVPILQEMKGKKVLDVGIGTGHYNTQYGDWLPYLSYDGLSLYFSRYNISLGGSIYEARRSQPSGSFTSVTQVFSYADNVYSPWVSPDNLRMYYHQELGTWSIKMSQRASVNDPFGNIQHLSAFDIPGGYSVHPAISSDGTAFYFTSGGLNGDIYVSYNVPEPETLLLLGIGGVLLRRSNR